MKDITYVQHEVTLEVLKGSIKRMLKDRNDEAFIAMTYNLLNSKVYIMLNESASLILKDKTKFPKELLFTPTMAKLSVIYKFNNKIWFPIFLTNDIEKEEIPDNTFLAEVDFYDICNLFWCNETTLDGFNIDPTDIGIQLTKEYIAEMCALKELIDAE